MIRRPKPPHPQHPTRSTQLRHRIKTRPGGQTTALHIAKEGGRVIAADISKGRLDDLVAENAGLDLVPVAGDNSTDETAAPVVAAVGGRVDALLNVAGIMDNLTSLMRLTRAVVALMLDAGSGSVVNVAS